MRLPEEVRVHMGTTVNTIPLEAREIAQRLTQALGPGRMDCQVLISPRAVQDLKEIVLYRYTALRDVLTDELKRFSPSKWICRF